MNIKKFLMLESLADKNLKNKFDKAMPILKNYESILND